MKKLVSLIFIAFISAFVFAEEFSLFPWTCNQKDIYTYCINKGWEYSSKTSSAFTEFSFAPSDDVTYHGQNIYNLNFTFDNTGTVVMQTITFDEILEASTTFPVVLDLMIVDKARLLDKTIDRDNYICITYETKLSNSVIANYVIYGQNNAFQLTVAYINK